MQAPSNSIWRQLATRRPTPESTSDRALEHQADRAADAVVSGGRPEPLGRTTSTNSSGAGQPLPASPRAAMEAAFDADFSGVRVHTDAHAANLSQNLHARALTHGADIYFGEGEFSPHSHAGRHLLAHELSHTLQQGQRPGQPWIQRQESSDLPEYVKIDFRPSFSDRVVTVGEANSIHVQFLAKQSELDSLDAKIDKANNVRGQIVFMNALIPDDMRLQAAYMGANGTTQMFLLNGVPTLYIRFDQADDQTVRHEMMHAVMSTWGSAYDLGDDYDPPEIMPAYPLPEPTLYLKVAELYGELVEIDAAILAAGEDPAALAGASDPDAIEAAQQPAMPYRGRSSGPLLALMFDPTTLGVGALEHPWDNYDEFIATAVSVYLSSPDQLRESLQQTVARVDKAVPGTGIAQWAEELMMVLEGLEKMAGDSYLEGLAELERVVTIDRPELVEQQLASMRSVSGMNQLDDGTFEQYSGVLGSVMTRSGPLVRDVGMILTILAAKKTETGDAKPPQSF